MTNQYRKKPIVIEAVQYDGDNEFDIKDWAQGVITSPFTYGKNPPNLEIKTLEGTMIANVGDWIIKGVKGEFYPCKPDIFEATYEPLEPATKCSQSEQTFGISLYADGKWCVENSAKNTIGYFTEEGFTLHRIGSATFLTPTELRQLADLVEATLKGGE